MKRVALNEALSFSQLIYGMWRLGDDADTSPSRVVSKIERCLDKGITTIDQADIYGGYEAEEIFGNALRSAPSLKQKIEIVTKCDIVAPAGRHAQARVKYYDTSAEHIQSSVDHSLRLMGVEKIDLLLVHRPDPFMDHHATGAALDALVKSGKVLNIGVSNFARHDWTLLQSAMKTRLATNQIELSVLANESFRNGDIAYLQEIGVRPMAWSPLAGGAMFRAENETLRTRLAEIGEGDAAAAAVAWLLAHPAGILPVLGTNKLERIAKLSRACDILVDRQTWFEIYEIANGYEVP